MKTLPHLKKVCQGVLRDQPQPGFLFSTTGEAEKRDPGNEVGFFVVARSYYVTTEVTKKKLTKTQLFAADIFI